MDKKQLEMIFGNYFAWMAKPATWIISFMNGTQNLFLLEGEQKALLIDTGYAVGNLRQFVEKLTDKPIIVVNSHFHPDHSGGNGEWEEVMLGEGYEKDEPSVRTTMGDLDALPYPHYRKIILKDGDMIDLGGRIIRVYRAADAHCHSHLYFLDTKERNFFMGDEMDGWQVMMFENSHNPEMEKIDNLDEKLRNYRSNLELVKSLDREYDWLLGNHNGTVFDKSYLDDYMALTDAVYSGRAEICDRLDHPFVELDPRAGSLCRIRFRKASIFVRKDQLLQLYGSRKA